MPSNIEEVCIHEWGHTIARYKFGRQVQGIEIEEISVGGNYSGNTVSEFDSGPESMVRRYVGIPEYKENSYAKLITYAQVHDFPLKDWLIEEIVILSAGEAAVLLCGLSVSSGSLSGDEDVIVNRRFPLLEAVDTDIAELIKQDRRKRAKELLQPYASVLPQLASELRDSKYLITDGYNAFGNVEYSFNNGYRMPAEVVLELLGQHIELSK